MKIVCQSCGKTYDYHKSGCCPECGAYNQPPRQDEVGSDGTVHHISEEDFWENGDARRESQKGKVCFEEAAQQPWEEPVRERQSRGNAWSYDEAPRSGAPAGGAARRPRRRAGGKGAAIFMAVIGIVVVLIFAGVFFTMFHTFHGVMGHMNDTMDQMEHMEEHLEEWQDDPSQWVGEMDAFMDEFFGAVEDGMNREFTWDEVPQLPEVEPVSAADISREAHVGDIFLWWGEINRVTDYSVDRSGSEVKIELYMQRQSDFGDPEIYYMGEDGYSGWGYYDSLAETAPHEYVYTFRIDDAAADSEFIVSCEGIGEEVLEEVQISLGVH